MIGRLMEESLYIVYEFYYLSKQQLHMRKLNIFELICLLAVCIVASYSSTISGSFALGSGGTYNPHTYSFVGGGNGIASFVLTYNSVGSVSQILMMVKTTNTPPTLTQFNILSYQHINFNASPNYDLQHANTGQPQVVEVGSMGSPFSNGNQIFIFVINFNNLLASSYTITVTELSAIDNTRCLPGNPLMSNSIYCSGCTNSQYAGAFCDIPQSNMTNGVTYTLQLYAWNDNRGNYAAVTIPGSSSAITLYYTASTINIINAIQFKSYSTDIAGLMNYATSGGLNSLTQTNTQYSININSGSSDISVSFLNLNTSPTIMSVWYTTSSSTNVLLIVLAVLGGVLFIGLVIVGVCMIRRMRNGEAQVGPLSNMMMVSGRVIRVGTNDLTVQEIEMYFPGVLCRSVFRQQEPSSTNLTAQGSGNAMDRDCVICLCPIVSSEMIKVTYCRHLFHEQCLNKWFQKQRNCPYCREEFTKKATIEHYQNMLKSSHRNMLMGVDLASQIINSRVNKSTVVIEEMKE